jgi:hypothetical protein
MSLPEKDLIRDKWLHHYESESDQLDAIRAEALSSLNATAHPATKGWIMTHPLFIAIAACWCVALLLNFTAPEVGAPAYAVKSPNEQNRAAPANSVASFATQHRLLFEYFNMDTELETEDAKRLSPENPPLSIPPPALLHKISHNPSRYIV